MPSEPPFAISRLISDMLFLTPLYEKDTFLNTMCASVLILGYFSSLSTSKSSLESITSAIRLADAALLVYITNILVTDIIAVDMRVKYCMNAITVSGSDLPSCTLDAASATTPTIPKFISIVIIGLASPIVTEALVSSFIRAVLTLSYLTCSYSPLDKALMTLIPITSSLTTLTMPSTDCCTLV